MLVPLQSRVYYFFDPVKGRKTGRVTVCGAIIEGPHEPLVEALPVLEGITKVVRKPIKRKMQQNSEDPAENDASPAAEDAEMQPAPKQQRRKAPRRAASVAPRELEREREPSVEVKVEDVPPLEAAHQPDFSSIRGSSGPQGDDAFSESSFAFSDASSQCSDATLVAGPSSHGIGHQMTFDRAVRGVQQLAVSNEMEEDAEELDRRAIDEVADYYMEV